MSSTDCLSAEELALLIDGRPSRSERRRWLSHVDTCSDCRTVLGEAAAYVDQVTSRQTPEPIRDAFRRMLRAPAFAPVLAAGFVALFALGVLLNPINWLSPNAEQTLSTRFITAPLFRAEGASYAEHRFRSRDRGLGFSSVVDARQRAFRTGVYLVDLRVSLHEGKDGDARQVLAALEPLIDDAASLESLRGVADDAWDSRTFDEIEDAVRPSLDGDYYSMGVWSESARLAAAANELAYFGEEPFSRNLAAFETLDLPQPQMARLSAIAELVSRGSGEIQPDELQRELRQLILLN